MEDRSRFAPWTPRLLILAAAACAALAAWRIWSVVWLREPSLVITGGCEEEALFSLWKRVHGQPVYADAQAIPYAVSYFNYLFYEVYGAWTAAWLNLLGLGDAWIPTIARCLTLLIVVANIFTLRRLMTEADVVPPGFGRAALWSAAALPFINPAVGLWYFTARPDWLAVLLELLGLFWLVRFDKQGGAARLTIAGVCMYAAWACKHSSVTVAAAWCLLNLTRRRWRPVVALAVPLGVAVGATLFLGGPNYLRSLLASQANLKIEPQQGVQLLVIVCQENPLLGVALVALAIWGWSRRAAFGGTSMQLLTWCLVLAVLLAFVTSMKAAASINYYYLAGALAMLWLLGLRRHAATDLERFHPGWLAGCAWIIAIVVQIALGASPKDRFTFQEDQQEMRALAARLQAMPGPALVSVRAGNLPWLQPHAPHFVVGTAYAYDRAAGVAFERGGLAGLANDGYFSVVVLTNDEPATIDGAPLAKYRLEAEDGRFRYYVRDTVK